ncbi:MAG: RAMP superfamily CRISPR-associated protein [Bacteroidales bacterium]|nr:RAMP superfamily CRISPR-associated protein [Bacteroidales bacterium]MDY0141568.1 RAMP superfamily CRISPR-associated protein [Bacteroidales bacterium]
MKNIKYEIEFFTDWHTGSGLAAGADLDSTVVKDKNGLPFVPGKTIKGLLREAVETLCSANDNVNNAFGHFDDKTKHIKGTMFFTNAVLSEVERDIILKENLKAHLYSAISSTAIDDDGIAKDHSLRKIEVTVPCKLYGEILDVPDNIFDDLVNGLRFVKRLGVNRNRGLGRCKFSINNDKEVKS